MTSVHCCTGWARVATVCLGSGNTPPLSPYLRRMAFIASVRSPRSMLTFTCILYLFWCEFVVGHHVEYLCLLVGFVL